MKSRGSVMCAVISGCQRAVEDLSKKHMLLS